jgi:hypothetical protein
VFTAVPGRQHNCLPFFTLDGLGFLFQASAAAAAQERAEQAAAAAGKVPFKEPN